MPRHCNWIMLLLPLLASLLIPATAFLPAYPSSSSKLSIVRYVLIVTASPRKRIIDEQKQAPRRNVLTLTNPSPQHTRRRAISSVTRLAVEGDGNKGGGEKRELDRLFEEMERANTRSPMGEALKETVR